MRVIIETLVKFFRNKTFTVRCAYCGRTKHDLHKHEVARTICCYPPEVRRAVVD